MESFGRRREPLLVSMVVVAWRAIRRRWPGRLLEDRARRRGRRLEEFLRASSRAELAWSRSWTWRGRRRPRPEGGFSVSRVEPRLEAVASWASAARNAWDFGVGERRLTTFGVAELEDEGARCRRCTPGRRTILLDAALGAKRRSSGGPRQLGDEGAEAADLADHRPALDHVHPHGGALNGRRSRLQAGQHHRHDDDENYPGGAKHDLLTLLCLRNGCGSLNVHCSSCPS